VVPIVLALALGIVAAPAHARSLTLQVPDGSTILITGSGFGHGHGMSQYGAQGAAQQGLDDRAILGFYYPGTTWGTAGGKVRVLITADTSRSVVVKARSGLKAKWVGHHRTWNLTHKKRTAKRWRIVPVHGGRSKVQYKLKAWHKLATVRGDLQFTAGGAPITLILPGGRSVAYRGVLRAASPHPGGMDRDTVNLVSLDGYLKGVVPREMPALWLPAALQSQAVAARTYAAFERATEQHGYYQLCDTSACQVYGGYSAEQPQSNAAVAATAGQILTYGGSPAFTQFSASNGGASLAGSQPYLVSQVDPYDTAYRNWTATVTPAAIQTQWPTIGQLTGITVTPSPANAPGAGYVATVTLTGTGGSIPVSGDAFRSFAGLRSSWFNLSIPG
jgi:SpoIID/LytB domain protein